MNSVSFFHLFHFVKWLFESVEPGKIHDFECFALVAICWRPKMFHIVKKDVSRRKEKNTQVINELP